jgi:hypothetical protein
MMTEEKKGKAKEWPAEHVKILNDNLEILSYAEIANLIGRTRSSVSQYCFNNKITRSAKSQKKINKRSNTTQFRKGQTPWNKDTKGLVKANSTSFKKGDPPAHVLPEFSISYKENKDGHKYKVIKIGTQWVRLHRYNWEQLYGPIPKGYVIIFKDGDSLNCDPENLECITKAEKMRREMSYAINRTETRKRLAQEQKHTKPLHFKKREQATVSDEIAVKINDKTTVFVKPGQDIEAVRRRYNNL